MRFTSAIPLALALTLGTSITPAQENAAKTRKFKLNTWTKYLESELRALKYIDGELEIVSVPVSETLTVEKVPVALIKAHCEHSIHVLNAAGYPTNKTSKLPATALEFAEYWLIPLTVPAEKPALQQRPMRDLIRADAKLHSQLLERLGKPGESSDQILSALPTTALTTRRLLPVRGSDGNNPFDFTPLSIVLLLNRFDPQGEVTEKNADRIAEEIVWTKRMGIGDGTYKTLPESRLILQAAILENLNFDIGNPGDEDQAKSAKAKENLAQAKKKVIELWREAAAKE